MNVNLEGKTALVTGASAGIGRAVAIELARSGAFVAVNYRNNEAGACETLDQVQQAGGKGLIVAADVSITAQVEQMMKTIAAHSPNLDILINNAGGLVQRAKVTEMSDNLWDEVMGINLKSTFLCCRAALPMMQGRGWGRIVNMSSQAAHDGGGRGATHYSAAKAAVIAFTKCCIS